MAKASTLFTYRDKDGVDVVVDRLDDVPPQYRASMKVMTLDGTTEVKAATKEEARAQVKAQAAQVLSQQAAKIDPTSVAIGGVGGVLVGCVLGVMIARGKRTRILGLMTTFLIIAACMTLYVTYLRQQSGLGSGGLASPTAIVDDAHKAKQAREDAQESQRKALEAIERSEKQ